MEELLDQNLIRGDRPLFEVMKSTINGRKVVSILKPLTRQETGIYTDSTGALHNLGGGNFIQTYVWKEKRNPCNPFAWWMGEPPLINNWDNYQEWTISPY